MKQKMSKRKTIAIAAIIIFAVTFTLFMIALNIYAFIPILTIALAKSKAIIDIIAPSLFASVLLLINYLSNKNATLNVTKLEDKRKEDIHIYVNDTRGGKFEYDYSIDRDNKSTQTDFEEPSDIKCSKCSVFRH